MSCSTATGPKLPDLVLYGTVRDLPAEAGDMKQASYVFHLKLADASGVTIWQDEKLITKQGTRNPSASSPPRTST